MTVPAEAAPTSFRLTDMQANGGMYDSAAYIGKPMVIEFYFNGCPYCDTNVPNFERMVSANHPAKAQVISISPDEDRSDYDAWIRRHRPTTPVLNGSANDGEVIRFFGVSGYPTVVVLDKNHNMIYKKSGVWSQATSAHIQRLIDGQQ